MWLFWIILALAIVLVVWAGRRLRQRAVRRFRRTGLNGSGALEGGISQW